MKYKDYGPYTKEVFDEMDKVFKQVDQVFKKMEIRMEEVMASAAEDAKPEPWAKWFAWYPVTVNNKRQWMKTVYRRTRLKYGDQRLIHEWEYTDIFGVLKEAGSGSKSI